MGSGHDSRPVGGGGPIAAHAPAAPPTLEGAPTAVELANAVFPGILDQPIQLRDGRWEGKPFIEGGASRPSAGMVEDLILTGDFDGDGQGETAVVLWTSSGGSGTFDYLAVVGRQGGQLVQLGTAPIGDRVQIRSARVVADRIVLDVVQAGAGDAACCPTQKATRTWTLGTGGLSERAVEITGTLSLADLGGTEWVLRQLARDEPAPPEPEITLVFEGDRIAGTSGCNRYFAGIEEDGDLSGQISVGAIGSTRMACEDDVMALESRFLERLEAVSRYDFVAVKLALTWQTEESTDTMLFAPQQRETDSPPARE